MIYTFNVHKRNIPRYTKNKLDEKKPIKTNKKGNKKINGSLLLTNLNSILSFVAELGLLGLNINLSKVCTKSTKQTNNAIKFQNLMIILKTQKGKVVKSTRNNRPGVPGSFTELLNLTRLDTCPLAIFTWI